MRDEFGLWLQQERDKRGMSQSELARTCGLHRAVVNKIENLHSSPTPETLLAIARGLKLPPEVVFRKAGLLPPRPETNPIIEALLAIVDTLPPEEQQEILEYAQYQLEKAERRKKGWRPAKNTAPP